MTVFDLFCVGRCKAVCLLCGIAHDCLCILLHGTAHTCHHCVVWDSAWLSLCHVRNCTAVFVLHGTVNGHLCVVWNSACLCVV